MYQITNYSKSKAGKGINVKLSSYSDDRQEWDNDIYIYIPFVDSLTEDQKKNPKTVVAAPTKSGDMCIKIPQARIYTPKPKAEEPKSEKKDEKNPF